MFPLSPTGLYSATTPFNLQLADPADLFLGTQSWEQIGGLGKVTRILRAPSHSVSLAPRASCLNPFAETRQSLGRVHLNMEVPADYLAHAIIIMEAA